MLDQINHNEGDEGDEAVAEMVTVMTTTAMTTMMMEMTVASVREVAVAMLKVWRGGEVTAAVVGLWRRGWRVRESGVGDRLDRSEGPPENFPVAAT
nr:hypothetical protein [Tanacetum cinerariifolium]